MSTHPERPVGLWKTLKGDVGCVRACDPAARHPALCNGELVGVEAKILVPIMVGANARISANAMVVEEIPPDMTVVGIPGRVVRGSRHCAGIDGRIDLEHHLMPDPVGEALSVVSDRIDFLDCNSETAS